MFYTYCLPTFLHTFALPGLGNLRATTLQNKMLAHKHGLGLDTSVGTHLFIALIVMLAPSRLEEHPKSKQKKRNHKVDKAHSHTQSVAP